MNKIILVDNTEIPALWVEEGSEYYRDANRRVLTVQTPKSAIGLDALDTLLADAGNLAEVRCRNEENGAQDSFANYSIKMSLAVKNVPVGEDEYGAAITEERIEFKLARLTPVELKLKAAGML